MNRGSSVREARSWIEKQFGVSDRTLQDQAILVAERGLSYGREMNKKLAELGGDRTLPEFQQFIQSEIIRSKEFGKIGGPIQQPESNLSKILISRDAVFGQMPIEPDLFGDNPNAYRGGIILEGHMEDALERFRAIMFLSGDETWADILQRASDWAITVAKYYPERLSGLMPIDEIKLGIEIVTGQRKF